jgi:hypothetical protein
MTRPDTRPSAIALFVARKTAIESSTTNPAVAKTLIKLDAISVKDSPDVSAFGRILTDRKNK